MSPKIDNIWQSATLDVIKPNKVDTSIDRQFTNNLVAPPIFTQVLVEKLSHSSSRYLYTRCRMNLAAYPDNVTALQFVNLGISTINSLDECTILWIPDIRVGMPIYVAYGSAPDHICKKNYSSWILCERKVKL